MNDHRPFADEGEVVTSLNAIRSEIASNQSHTVERLARIEAQTTRTNGRVTKLELRSAFLTGGLAVIGILSGWVMFLITTGHLK